MQLIQKPPPKKKIALMKVDLFIYQGHSRYRKARGDTDTAAYLNDESLSSTHGKDEPTHLAKRR